MKKKLNLRKITECCIPLIGGALGAGLVLVAYNLLNSNESGWDLYALSQEQLQKLIDEPETTVVFEEAHAMICNKASSEL